MVRYGWSFWTMDDSGLWRLGHLGETKVLPAALRFFSTPARSPVCVFRRVGAGGGAGGRDNRDNRDIGRTSGPEATLRAGSCGAARRWPPLPASLTRSGSPSSGSTTRVRATAFTPACSSAASSSCTPTAPTGSTRISACTSRPTGSARWTGGRYRPSSGACPTYTRRSSWRTCGAWRRCVRRPRARRAGRKARRVVMAATLRQQVHDTV